MSSPTPCSRRGRTGRREGVVPTLMERNVSMANGSFNQAR